MDEDKFSSAYSYEISKKILSKKSFIQSSIDEILTTLQNDYNVILHQKDIELALMRAKEGDHIKDMKNLLSIKKELIETLENETRSHKKALETIEYLEREHHELRIALEEVVKRLESQTKTWEAEREELLAKIAALETKTPKNEPIIENRPEAKRLNAYTQVLKEDENERLLRSLKGAIPSLSQGSHE